MTAVLDEELTEHAFTCADCGKIAIPQSMWNTLTRDVKTAATSLGYRPARTHSVCRRCQDASDTPPTLRNLPKGRYDEHGKYVPACETDPEAWFPDAGQQMKAERAKAVCATCPLREQCLEIAMEAEAGADTKFRYGIFGGLSPRQRHALAREQGKQGLPRGWVTLFCRNGHARDVYYDKNLYGCHACYCISNDMPVETLVEHRQRLRDRELRGDVRRAAGYNDTPKVKA